MDGAVLLWALLTLPMLLAGICVALRSPRQVLILVSVGGAMWGVLAGVTARNVLAAGSMVAARGYLHLDALSAYHLALLGLVQGASSIYAWGYFGSEVASGALTASLARRFGGLWFGAAAAMAAVLTCNNLGLMWVGVEATTLLTAFLISVHVTPLSLEATWKYLVVCSVGVAFAFVGTLLLAASATQLGLEPSAMLLWTRLADSPGRLAAGSMKLAFLFLLVGYGTKAGLAPLHSWLPDAHSQAPAPVSALFSGFMLNAAFYCVLRVLPLVEAATGWHGWGRLDSCGGSLHRLSARRKATPGLFQRGTPGDHRPRRRPGWRWHRCGTLAQPEPRARQAVGLFCCGSVGKAIRHP